MTYPPRNHRPSPDALLESARRAERGKLKIFLGAAPGVGKTYEMLAAARRKQRDGVDVVIGIVETHGRRETEVMLRGLPSTPRRVLNYQGHPLEDMDLEALLQRRPELALVDELAHSNAPGCRHAKRHQDVEELLRQGIDVYTTLNIQHLDSLNDVVAGITHVIVRETVPDAVLEQADAIEVIDLTPQELIERLREGRVYPGEAGDRALRGYFNTGNLTALRELALRYAADRVEQQLRQHRAIQGVPEPWTATSDRLLVCIDEAPGATSLVRHAKRLASRLDAPWTALHLENERSLTLNDGQRDRIAEALRVAERLGGDVVTYPGSNDVATDVLAYAQQHGFNHLITGRNRRSMLFRWRHGSIVNRLLKRAENISVQVIAEGSGKPEAARQRVVPLELSGWAVISVLISVGIASVLGWLLSQQVQVHNIALLFLSAVMFSSLRLGRGAGVLAALLSGTLYNFLFLPPRLTFTVHDPANVLALLFYLVVALILTQLLARVRQQNLAASAQARTNSELLNLSRRLSGARAAEQVAAIATEQAALMLNLELQLLLPTANSLLSPLNDKGLDSQELAAAQWCLSHGQAAGRGTDTLPASTHLYLPLKGTAGSIGVLRARHSTHGGAIPAVERRLLGYMADLAAGTLERIQLNREVDKARVLAETEQLRSALLSSISHDLRTPLTGIMGAISSLRAYHALYDDEQRETLLATAQEETERMQRFMSNLLDMTRLDAGALQARQDPCDLGEIVNSALQRCARLLQQHHLHSEFCRDLPMIKLDFVLFEQALVNLLENAAKYSPPGSRIDIVVQRHRYALSLSVNDEGPGVPAADLEHLFDPFFRVRNSQRQSAGIGLGLAVCRGFVTAMGCQIRARNRVERGACFEIDIPASLLLDPLPIE